MVNRRFTYTDPVITANKADNTNTFLWLAFSQNTDGNCIIEKQSPFEPTQTFFTIERAVTEIKNIDLSSAYLYVVYNDTTAFIERFSLSNPLTSFTQITRPVGINEAGVDILYDGTDIWVLTPGTASGENAKLLRYNTSLVFQETVDLTKSGSTVTDAISVDNDSNGDLWIAMNTNPGQYVRVFALSGGGYDFTIHLI